MSAPIESSAPVDLTACPVCAEPVHDGDRFCEACGSDLETPPVDEAAPASEDGQLEPPAPVPCLVCGNGQLLDGWCDTCGARAPEPRDHVEQDLGHVALVSDKGHRHHRNEDGHALAVSDGQTTVTICDGVSSTVNPHLASAAAASASTDALHDHDGGDDDGADPTAGLVAAHRAAAGAVIAVDAPPHADLGVPSCTWLAATIEHDPDTDHVRIASLGDCRAYWVPEDDDEPRVVTLDDSWMHEAIASGMAPEVAARDPRAHVITRWLGRDADPTWEPEVTVLDIGAPGRLVLCSDGLWNYLPTPGHLRDLLPDAPPIEQARRLVQFALDAGGHDNVTVAVVALPRPAPTGTNS